MKTLRVAMMIALGPAALTVSADPYQRCVSLTESMDRLACYDTVAAETRRVAPLPSTQPQQTHVTPSATLSPVEEQFGLPPERRASVGLLTASVAAVQQSAFGKLAIALDNGQNWQQVDNARLRLNPGERVVIRTAALGSHLLEKESGSRRIRVRRITD